MLRQRFDDLPLSRKLLLPFLTLVVLFGAFGSFVIVRDLSTRAQTQLDQEVAQRTLEARSHLRDRELFLLESANLAANLEGMSDAVRHRDAAEAGRLLGSVMALKPDLAFVAVADPSGTGIVEFTRPVSGEPLSFGTQGSWGDVPFVRAALADAAGRKSSGLLTVGDRRMLAIAAPVCSSGEPCASVGVALTGLWADSLVTGATLFDETGAVLAGARTTPRPPRTGTHRHTDGRTIRYVPFEVDGRAVGTLAVSVSTTSAMAAVRAAGYRLAAVVVASILGVLAIGVLLSRAILRPVGALLETSRAIGRGRLEARVPVERRDELGELARGVNQMAEQLQASYENLELRVAQRTEEVRRLLHERTEFFASLSHELRTPLAAILGEVTLMERSARKVDKETARRLRYSADQLLSLVNDVLDLARAESGRTELAVEDVSVADLVEEMRPTLEGLTRGNGLSLSVDVPADLALVRADRGRVREVILNLVDNAVKYTPEGGSVQVAATAPDGKVEVAVSDTGIGIPSEAAPFLFEPFFTVPGRAPERGAASTGLGLAVAKRLVEAQDGTISFESEPGRGSVFRVALPKAGP